MTTDDPNLEPFDDEQFMTMFSAIRIESDGGVTDEEMQRLCDWAHRVHVEGLCLDLLLQGEVVVVGFEGDQPRFAAPEVADRRDTVALAAQIALGQEPRR